MSENLKLAVEITMVNGQFKAEILNSEKLTQQLGKSGAKSFDDLAAAAGRAPGPVGRVASSLSGVASMASRVSIAVYAGAAALGAYFAAVLKGTQIAAEHQRQMLRMEAQIRATGGAAGKTAEDIDQIANSLSRRSLFTDDQIREAAGRLLTFTSITGAAFDRTIEVAADLAEIMGGDLVGAVTLLGKAGNDPVEALNALKRASIDLSPAQEKLIINLAETGRKGEAVNAMLDAVSGKVGGAAAAAAAEYSGALHNLGESFEDLMKAFEKTGPFQYFIRMLDAGLQRTREFVNATGQEEFNKLFSERHGLKQQNERFGEGHPNVTANNLRIAEIDQRLTQLQNERMERDKKQNALMTGGRKDTSTVSLSEKELKAIEDLAKAEAKRRENADGLIRDSEVRLGLLREEQSLGRQMTDAERDLYLLRMGAYDDLLPSEREQLRLVLETTAALERQTEVTVELAEKSLTFTDGLVQGLEDFLQYATDAYSQGLNLAETFFGSLEDTMVQALNTGKFAWKDFGNVVIEEINRIAVQALLAGLKGQLIGLAVNVVGASVGNIGAGDPSLGPISGPKAHTGGVLGADRFPTSTVPAYTFAGAARFHSGGMIGSDEVPVIAKRGEGIFTPAQMRAMGGGGGSNVNITNNIDASGGTQAAQIRDLMAGLRENNKQLKAQLEEARRRNH